MAYKKVLTIQDISCVGQCSLTVALPILSAAGQETCILPSAVLSTHTAGFTGYTVRDLTADIPAIAAHWEKEQIRFDAVYTGYLGTIEQIGMISDIISAFRQQHSIVIVDPVMADNGKLYPAFNMDYVKKNAELCAAADIIVPNITEAAFMTGMEYKERYDIDYVKALLARLSELGAGISVLTGVSLEQGKTGIMGYDRSSGTHYVYQNRRIDASFHGTGAIFSSTCVGEIMKGKDWRDAMRIAADYTAHTIEVTLQNPKKPWYGVDFEATLPTLMVMD